MKSRPVARTLVLLMMGVSGSAGAQGVLDSTALLGMGPGELAAHLPPMQAVRPARRLSSGAVGSLRVADVLYESLHFEQTLYLANQKLQQTDLVMSRPAAEGISALLQSLRTQLGAELASSYATPDTVMETSSWVSGDADITLFYSSQLPHPSARLVIRQRQLRDAGEL